MFDSHTHSRVSFDTDSDPRDMLAAAEAMGLRELCFTDHYDYRNDPAGEHDLFSLTEYAEAYDGLYSEKVKIRRGIEFGMTEWNMAELAAVCAARPFDFVIGSVHSIGGGDPYFAEYWEGKTVKESFEEGLLQTLACVQAHDGFDVLGHLNYVCKSPNMPEKKLLRYRDYADMCDEIMRVLVSKGKGMEINTSGKDCVGVFLPDRDFLLRFRELGGEIVTVGSDAHTPDRVGKYVEEAVKMAKEIFGYVCTFEARKPIFHKI